MAAAAFQAALVGQAVSPARWDRRSCRLSFAWFLMKTFPFICVYLRPLLRSWRYHKYLNSITLAGSHAKGTDLQDSDVDIFLRLSHVTP